MQQRRFRPGDVLDDYCPRERRITDHAIVAMIEDDIKQTRCVVCDAEHEYKEGKVPAQRRRKAQTALFNEVLDGLQGPKPAARRASPQEPQPQVDLEPHSELAIVEDSPVEPEVVARAAAVIVEPAVVRDEAPVVAAPAVAAPAVAAPVRDEGFFRRTLIRASLPRPEGQQPPARVIPEFTIRQPGTGHGRHRPGRRRGGAQAQGAQGPMRFGRSEGQGQRPQGRGGRGHAHGVNGNGNSSNGNGRHGNHQGGRRRGGKKR
jgi:hypothetical protein